MRKKEKLYGNYINGSFTTPVKLSSCEFAFVGNIKNDRLASQLILFAKRNHVNIIVFQPLFVHFLQTNSCTVHMLALQYASLHLTR